MRKSSIKIGISLGDPAGVGPEVTLKAIKELGALDFIPVVFGRYEITQKHYPAFIKDYTIIDDHRGITPDISSNKYFFNIQSSLPVPTPGIGNTDTGSESRIYIDKTVEMWQEGVIDAVVTGPVSKGLIESSGCHFTGHTEYIAELINEEGPYMMMYSSEYRVLLVTTHVPVADIAGLIDAEKIYKTILIGHKSISAIDGDDVKIAVTGLDPHCGDNGAISDFDENVTKEAIRMARADGINIEGPFAADTLFMPNKWISYNLIVAHYHDQGLIPFKVLAFDSGVNVTLGLSIIRTSPDHGTAYDIAGKDAANCGSMVEAIKLAYSLARARQG